MGWITRATREQDKGSEQVMVAEEDIRNTTNTDLEAIHVMDKSLVELYSQAEILKKEMSVFRV